VQYPTLENYLYAAAPQRAPMPPSRTGASYAQLGY
jgi:hypothetical protein